MAKAGDGTVNQARIDRLERLVTQSIAVQIRGLEIFHQNIATPRKFADQRLSFGPRNIDRHRFLAAIGAEIVGGFSSVRSGAILQVRRTPAASVIAAAGALDLDNLGSQIRQNLTGPRAREHTTHVEHP